MIIAKRPRRYAGHGGQWLEAPGFENVHLLGKWRLGRKRLQNKTRRGSGGKAPEQHWQKYKPQPSRQQPKLQHAIKMK